MAWKLGTIYLLSLFFLTTIPFFPKKSSPKRISVSAGQSQEVRLLRAYLIGDRRGLSRKIIDRHKKLNLLHLFTPSGLHLSALFLFLLPFTQKLKEKSRKGHLLLQSILCGSTLFLPGLFSLKRMALYRFARQISPQKICSFSLFLIIFLYDLLFGSFPTSPTSWVYSFLFLGIIFSTSPHSPLFLCGGLFGGQILIAFFQGTSLTYASSFLGFLMTALFGLVFPIFLAIFGLGKLMGAYYGISLVSVYLKSLSGLALLAEGSGSFFPSLPIVFAVILIAFPKRSLILIIFLLLIHSTPAFNMNPKFINEPKESPWPAPEEWKELKRSRTGFISVSHSQLKCYHRLRNTHYKIRCKE